MPNTEYNPTKRSVAPEKSATERCLGASRRTNPNKSNHGIGKREVNVFVGSPFLLGANLTLWVVVALLAALPFLLR